MHAPLDDSAAELDPASIHRIERGHPVAGNLRRSLSPSLAFTLCRCQSTTPESSEADCRTPEGVKATGNDELPAAPPEDSDEQTKCVWIYRMLCHGASATAVPPDFFKHIVASAICSAGGGSAAGWINSWMLVAPWVSANVAGFVG